MQIAIGADGADANQMEEKMLSVTEKRPRDDTLPGELRGRVALVTGSTSGIGLAIARALAAAGADVMVNGFGDRSEIDALCAAIRSEHAVRAAYEMADLGKVEEIEGMVGRIALDFGRVDILVNNAGIQHVAPIAQFPVEKWNAIIALNLSAAFHLTRSLIGPMMTRGYGRIVNIASAHGLVASPFKSAYVAAKHGLVGLTKVTALEGAEHGVTANAICPGYVWTPLVEQQIDDQAKSHGISRDEVIRDILLAQQPNKKFSTPEEIGALTAFLCSEAAQTITGTAMPIDGGWTAH
jgi:3-hydroxybutyrate dehydrogenase